MDLISESNRLAAKLVTQLREDQKEKNSPSKVIVAYSGEFQPFHNGHYDVYTKLVDKFGKDSVYIVTGESEDSEQNAPLKYIDKKVIVTELFDINEDHIEQVDNPYIPKELLEQFPASSTSFITVVDGDAASLLEKSEYFEHYNDKIKLKPYKTAGYFLEEAAVEVKVGNKTLSEKQLVQILGSDKTAESTKDKILDTIFPKQNKKISDLLKNKTSDKSSKSKSTKADDNSYSSDSTKKTYANDQSNKSPKVSGSKSTPIMQRKIRNPDSGKEIKIQSALKYPRWKRVYKMANQVLKVAGIDRKDRVKEPEVNVRYKSRAAKKTTEDISMQFSQQITEEILRIAKEGGISLNVEGYGNINFKLPEALNEGGASGHLNHPYDDVNLSFDDLGEMINRGLSGGLDAEAPVTEKLDGQNIQFSFKDGKVVFARNAGHIKNKGATALDVDGLKNKFAGRGDIEAGFGNAADDISAAIASLDEKQRSSMFNNGSKWVNLEIINPKTQNVIPYDKNVLVFHNTVQYDDAGNITDLGQTEGGELARAIQKVGADKQRTYGIQGPQNIAFSSQQDNAYKARHNSYIKELDKIRKSSGLSNTSKLGDYFTNAWSDKIDMDLQRAGVKLPPAIKSSLIKRWSMYDKSFGAKQFKKEYPQLSSWFDETEKASASINKDIRKPIEMLFLKVGADSLARMTNFMSANNPAVGEALKKEVLNVIERLKEDPTKASDLLTRELERLENIGMDKITPSEGVVFIYGGKPYKFTGAFAPINQLMGVFKYGKGVQPEADSKEHKHSTIKPIAVYPGRFQPFHVGHYSVYKDLVAKFGEDNVYIGTSDKTDSEKSPFGFDDKKHIMEKMFGIPSDKIVKVKNPYAPIEVLSKYPENTPFVTAVSQKDADRLDKGGKYFKKLPDDSGKIQGNYKDVGYYYIAPEFKLDVNGTNISGTTVRNVLGDRNTTDAQKKKLFSVMYGRFDPQIFNLVTKKLIKSSTVAKIDEPKKQKAVPQDKPTKKQHVSVLNKKVRNPETGRDILVKTALGYEKNHPARKAAMKLVTQSQR